MSITLSPAALLSLYNAVAVGVDPLASPGHTHLQLCQAPKNSMFIWHSNDLEHPISIKRQLGREDILLARRILLSKPNTRLHPEVYLRTPILDHRTQDTLTPTERTRWEELKLRHAQAGGHVTVCVAATVCTCGNDAARDGAPGPHSDWCDSK